MRRSEKFLAYGFTLIELLVVISIIGGLTAVTVPAAVGARDRGQSAATLAEVGSYETAAAVFLADSGSFPVPDSEDIPESCYEYDSDGATASNPRLCCVADEPCTYAGKQLQPLSRGAFTKTVGGSRAGLLGGAISKLPKLPKRPLAVGSLRYQGVFHSCDTATCQNPTVTWTQPTSCPAGTTRNGVSGLCQRSIDRTLVTVIAASEWYCYDGEDDDGDGDTDCADSDCAHRAKCGVETGSERCADEFDNNGDGAVDCDDDGCAGVEGCAGVCNAEQATEIDSDADCVEDYSACWDEVDNDGDGDVDCADSDCEGAEGCDDVTEGICYDGEDNDGDGAADCADMDCEGLAGDPWGAAFCTFGSEGSSNCIDGFDNDGDGAADCADADCLGQPECPHDEICDNSFDDDDDGLIDCNDPDCAECALPEGDCENGVDDDFDGATDCADPDCDAQPECA